nr:5-oxoprolinase [Tanacetum cinerariifolium]
MLSGSVGGVIEYSQTLFRVKIEKPLIRFDMGGTSIDIGNQARPNSFDLTVLKPSNLYAEVIEVDERIDLASEPDESNLVTGISGQK